jgi:hypothetical protein
MWMSGGFFGFMHCNKQSTAYRSQNRSNMRQQHVQGGLLLADFVTAELRLSASPANLAGTMVYVKAATLGSRMRQEVRLVDRTTNLLAIRWCVLKVARQSSQRVKNV